MGSLPSVSMAVSYRAPAALALKKAAHTMSNSVCQPGKFVARGCGRWRLYTNSASEHTVAFLTLLPPPVTLLKQL